MLQAAAELYDQSMEAQALHIERVVTVIPAYNEERFIGSTVLAALEQTGCVIVVDDGSQDETARRARSAGAIVVRHACNCGKGAALNTGLQEARRFDPQAVVLIDADGQHRAQEMAQLLKPILLGEADIVVGSRYLKKGNCVPGARLLGHRLFNLVTRLASGVRLSDSQSGYRAFSGRALEQLCFCSQGFAVESEMQFLARQHGLRIQEVDITVLYADRPKRPLLFHGLLVLSGLIGLTGKYRPLFFYGLIGIGMLLLGLALGLRLLPDSARNEQLALIMLVFSLWLMVVGGVIAAVGFILHWLRATLQELFRAPKS
jgi:glycosyltransferase involved in cell wall biosynthesis